MLFKDEDNYFDESNTEVLSISMVETRESVKNLNDIVENNGIRFNRKN